MTLEEFLNIYETTTNTHDFSQVAPLIDENAIYWFSDGSYIGIEAIRKAFESTWGHIRDEVYSIENIQWIFQSDEIGICRYHFKWAGTVRGKPRSGNGRGTNVIQNKNGAWKMVHEHLSK